VGDDHHRDALGRDTGPFEILHEPGELTGAGPQNVTEAGIDQHTIGRVSTTSKLLVNCGAGLRRFL